MSLQTDSISHKFARLKKLKLKRLVFESKLNAEDNNRLTNLQQKLSHIYLTAKVCSIDSMSNDKQNCTKIWTLEKNVRPFMANNTNYRQLLLIWKAWRHETGRKMKTIYRDLVELYNLGARNAGYADIGAYWRLSFEDGDMEKTVEELWRQILPMYEQLHTYVRRQLLRLYPQHLTRSSVPAHLFGNMWAQVWTNLFQFTEPFKNKSLIDASGNMVKLGYTPQKFFDLADNFFKSLGMIEAPPKFWNNSLFTKPVNRSINCYPGAFDMKSSQKDFRVKMCTSVNMFDFIVAHHEMGHIQGFLQYAKQPNIFKNTAHAGFHEAVGDAISLSVSTPSYLKSLGLLPGYQPDEQQDINYLYKQALFKLAFLPIAYVTDLWRWRVFDGTYQYNEWNNKWWKLREKYQGMHSPVARQADDFDPGAKRLVAENQAIMRYFFSFIVQFQFYKALCSASGYRGPLHKCNFYNSTAAGAKLADMLKVGSSVAWPIVLQKLTGEKQFSVEPLKEYFEPLMTWLQRQNEGDCFGWGYQWPDSYNLPTPRCSMEWRSPDAFVATSGTAYLCQNNSDCVPYKEPVEWCHLTPGRHEWLTGCHCDEYLGKCIIERLDRGNRQYAYCSALRKCPIGSET